MFWDYPLITSIIGKNTRIFFDNRIDKNCKPFYNVNICIIKEVCGWNLRKARWKSWMSSGMRISPCPARIYWLNPMKKPGRIARCIFFWTDCFKKAPFKRQDWWSATKLMAEFSLQPWLGRNTSRRLFSAIGTSLILWGCLKRCCTERILPKRTCSKFPQW